jgi:hypothetical protein
MSDISNKDLKGALQQPRPEWSHVRWVNVQVCCTADCQLDPEWIVALRLLRCTLGVVLNGFLHAKCTALLFLSSDVT